MARHRERTSFKDAPFYRIDFTGARVGGAAARPRRTDRRPTRLRGDPHRVRLSAGREGSAGGVPADRVNEHWEHRLFAERDLSLPEKEN
ncbi:hypothetical protein GCM10009557_16970 [Virgisporangium ochraceum]|uniref:Uncharacterized protein n=1 Tax=Virgisporangium ochraceum TaxID=65505 RepID=A0A8J3ZPG5_9ACTN|nr:hypothetical protein Voc01_004150 [Virgisporangium ochraceum]